MKKLLSILYIFLLLPNNAAHASGCNYVRQKKISFSPGSVCWSFEGRANTFVGDFNAGQKISLRTSGRDANIDNPIPENRRPWEEVGSFVDGPNNFKEGDTEFQGRLNFIAPFSGKYKVVISPCSYWSSQIKMEICAR